MLAWAWRGGVALSLPALPAWEFHRHRPTTDQAHGAYVAALTREGLAAVETDIVIETSGGAERAEFNRIRKEEGLKAAIAWRNSR